MKNHWLDTVEGRFIALELYIRYFVEFRINERYTEIFDYEGSKWDRAVIIANAFSKGICEAFQYSGPITEPMQVSVERVLTFSEYCQQIRETPPTFQGIDLVFKRLLMRQIKCDNCSKHMLDVCLNDNEGNVAAKVRAAGFIPKNPILFTGKNQWLYFCSDSCSKEKYASIMKDLDKNKVESTNKAISELKKDIPKMASETAKSIDNFMKNLYGNK